MKRLLYILPVAAFLAAAAIFFSRLGYDPAVLPSALMDKPAPNFALPSPVEGVPGLATGDLAGAVTVVNFFASWCVPCQVEHPQLSKLAAEGAVRVFGIAYKDKPEDTRRWLERLGNPYARIGEDRDGRVAIEWGVYGVPETFVLDREGRIRRRHAGPVMERDLEDTIRPLVRELSK